MKNYDGPSIYKKKHSPKDVSEEIQNYSDYPSSSLLSDSAGKIRFKIKRAEKKERVNFSEKYRLPENFTPKSEEEQEREGTMEAVEKVQEQRQPHKFKENQTFKEAVSETRVPFRVTEVPSPMLGYTSEQKKRMNRFMKQPMKSWNYSKLKETFNKIESDYFLVEGFETEELMGEWKKQHKEALPEKPKRNYRLNRNRTLKRIIKENEEELGLKNQNVSRLFSTQNEKKK